MTRIPIGQLIKKFPAGTFNRLVDDLERRQKGQPPGNDAGPGAVAPPHGVFVRVVNETGAALEEYGIAKLDEPSFTAPTISGSDEADEATLSNLTFDLAAATASDTDAPVVVTREPIADGEPGMAMVQGVTWARVEVSDAGHEYAAPTTSDSSKFTSTANATRFRILYKQSGTGTKWAVVELGSSGTPADIIYARVNNTGGTSADANLYAYDSGVSITGCVTASATGQFRNNNQVLADSQRVILVKRQDTGEYEPEQAGEPSTVIIGRALVNDATGVAEGDATLAFDGASGSTGTFSSATGTASNLHSKAFGDNEELLLIEDAANNFYAVKVETDIIVALVNEGSGVSGATATFAFDNGSALEGVGVTTGTAKNACAQTWLDNEPFIGVLCDDGQWLAIKQNFPSVTIAKALINNASGYDSGDASVAYDSAQILSGNATFTSGTASNVHSKAFRDNEEILIVYNESTGIDYAVKIEVDIQKAAVNDATDVLPTDATFAFDGGNVTVLEGVGEASGTAKNPCAIAWSDDENILQILADDGQQIAIKQHDACVFFADAAEDVAATDTDFSADGIVRFMNKEPGVAEPITVKNTVGATLSDNDKFIAARDYLGEYEVLSVIAQTCVIFRCKPTSNLTGESSFTGGTLTEVFGTPPAGPTETINNPLALYSTTSGWITCVVKTDGTFEAIYAEEHVQQWLKAQSGYNASNNQVFHHDAGTFKWGDYGTCS